MGKPAVSLRHKLIALCAAGLLACGLLPIIGYAADDDSVAGPLAGPGYEDDARSASSDSALPSVAEGAILASSLAPDGASIVSADVALDAAEPVVGSFTVDGLTYALNDGKATLISVGATFVVAPYEGSADSGDGKAIAIPSSVTYSGITYPVIAVGLYAFYLSGATSVALPASILSVDDRAFRSSDVERVEVDPANPNIASFDGALYSADLTRLLLIPEGRKGSVLLSCETEVVEPSLFSHCSLVEAISVEEGGAAFSSWNGLLYDASGETLLRVPAGATDITIRDGCTAIAAGAMEGCAKLERIDAPASGASISSDVFESIPTVSLPAMALQDESVAGPLAGPGYEGDARSASADSPAEGESTDSAQAEGEAEASPRRVVASSQGGGAEEAEGAFGSEGSDAKLVPLGATSPQPPAASSAESADTVASSLLDQANASANIAPQLTAMVALSSADDDLPEVDPSSIEVTLPEGADAALWERFGFLAESTVARAPATLSQANVHKAAGNVIFYLQRSEVLYGLWVETGEYVNQNCAPVYNGWFYSGHGLNDEAGHYFQLRWDDARGLYLRRSVGGLAAFDVWPATRATSASLTPTGPDLAQGTYVGSGATVYFRTDNVIGWNPNGGTVGGIADPYYTYHSAGTSATSPQPSWDGYAFLGWYTEPTGGERVCGAGEQTDPIYAHDDYYAHWGQVVSFDTDSEPGDADYPGEGIDDRPVTSDEGQVEIENPKRPGYVFEGWVIPSSDGTEAVDQDLVYQGDDGKWYVDASKLPDYAGDDGKVELTARWTAALSVDAPISATFMYDLSAWDGSQSRDAYVEGSSTVKNRSAVPIRVSGIESKAGDAASVLKRGDGTTLADASAAKVDKVLSVFPTTSAVTGTEGDAKGPASDDAADDLAHKVDMALSDVKLEAAFDHGAWAVDAATVGDNGVTVSTGDLKLGYRLNLGTSTGVTLDQDALLGITGEPEGTDASAPAAIANLTYCFAAEGLIPTGTKSDPLWVEVTDPEVGSVGVYGLSDIKRAAEDFSSRVDPATDPNDQDAIYAQLAASPYFELFRQLLEHDVSFQVEVDGRYLPLQLLGICQDTKTADGRRAGLTFQMRDIYAYGNKRSTAAGGGTFASYMNSSNTNSNGWGRPANLRSTLRSTFWGYLSAETQAAIVGVDKHQQLPGGTTAAYLQKTTNETIWLPSVYEVFGTLIDYYDDSEALTTVAGYAPFQYMAYQPAATSNISTSVANTKAIKAFNNSANRWWSRSAKRNNTYAFAYVTSSGSLINNANEIAAYGVAPCFCL